MESKICKKCQQEKPLSEFYFNRTHEAYFSWCKTCSKQRAVQSRRELRNSDDPEDLLKKRIYDLLSSCKSHLNLRRGKKLSFDLNVRYLIGLFQQQKGNCYYTGTPMKIKKANAEERDLLTISLDRIDSNEGYIPGNVVFCCWGINALKGIESPEKMYDVLKLFYEGAKKRGKVE